MKGGYKDFRRLYRDEDAFLVGHTWAEGEQRAQHTRVCYLQNALEMPTPYHGPSVVRVSEDVGRLRVQTVVIQ
jgi:hypothetical protein